METNTNLTLKKVKDLGGRFFEIKEGRTSYTTLNRVLSIQKINLKEGTKLIVLNFTNCSKVQAVFEILDINNEDSPLKQIYSDL